MSDNNNDPFSIDADPDLAYVEQARVCREAILQSGEETSAPDCACQIEQGVTTRRQALIGAGILLALPLVPAAASAAVTMVPCRQTRQKIRPCHHKFCRHYGGGEDFYGR